MSDARDRRDARQQCRLALTRKNTETNDELQLALFSSNDWSEESRQVTCPIPASSGMTTGRHRLNRGGHRQANAALYRAVIVRMRYHQPTVDDVARRTADGRTKREIIRCLKRFLAREIYQRVMTDFRARQEIIQPPASVLNECLDI